MPSDDNADHLLTGSFILNGGSRKTIMASTDSGEEAIVVTGFEDKHIIRERLYGGFKEMDLGLLSTIFPNFSVFQAVSVPELSHEI